LEPDLLFSKGPGWAWCLGDCPRVLLLLQKQ
jgi:hypothetical protein